MKNLFDFYFSKLNKSGIVYAITGIIDDYPDRILSDIDIIIPRNQFDLFWTFMKKIERDHIDWIQVISHEITAYYCVISISNSEKQQIIKPDICSDYYRNGTLLLSADYILKGRFLNNRGFYQLSPDKEFIYYLLKKIDKNSIDNKQFTHLYNQWEKSREVCCHSLISFFSEKKQKIIKNSLDNNNFDFFKRNIKLLKKELRKNITFSLYDYLLRIKNRINRVLNPTGLFVVFMGPDGCGKTSIISGIKDDMTSIFRKYEEFHLFPIKRTHNEPINNPHEVNKRNYIASVIKLFYLLFIYFFGYWFRIYKYKIKSTLVLFDRYFHDFFIDSHRYRYGAGKIWLTLISYFIPKPDLWILLDASPEVIQNRKSEVSVEETTRQVGEYRKLFNNLENGYIINANQNIEKVIYDTQETIIKYMKMRTKRRYKNF